MSVYTRYLVYLSPKVRAKCERIFALNGAVPFVEDRDWVRFDAHGEVFPDDKSAEVNILARELLLNSFEISCALRMAETQEPTAGI